MNSFIYTASFLLALPVWLHWSAAFFSFLCFLILLRIVLRANKKDLLQASALLVEKTELLQYEKENVQKALDEVKRVNQSKSILLSRINHEVRTPLNAIQGMSALLQETTMTGEQSEYVGIISEAGEKLLVTVKDMLMHDIIEYSRMDATKELVSKDFDLRNTVEEVLGVMAMKVMKKNLHLAYEMDADVPAQIVGDALRLSQILINLIDNAITHTDQGEIIIRVHAPQPASASGEMELSFEVSDTGNGFPQEKLGQLNAELMQADLSINNSYVAGLSLVICQRLVTLMGGRMQVKSKEGRGSRFLFSIQAATGQQAEKPIHYKLAAIRDKKILLIEHSEALRSSVRSILKKLHLDVVQASNAEDALDLLTQNAAVAAVIFGASIREPERETWAPVVHRRYPHLPLLRITRTSELTTHRPELFAANIVPPVLLQDMGKQLLKLLPLKAEWAKEALQKQVLSADFSKQFPLRILVAEDNLVNQKLIRIVLNKLGYQPEIAADGKIALDRLSQKTFDMVLMDVDMPVMDGLEATRMIRLCLEVQPIIIAMTANTMQGDREACLQAGMDDYLSKPLQLEEVVEVIEKWALQERKNKGPFLEEQPPQ